MNNDNKRIALNTLYLYTSSFLQLFIGLYTSRILLQALGIKDFGIYGVVGGIIALLSFINTAMGSASSRYIIFELANGNIKSQKKVFSTIFFVHLSIAIIIILAGETIGLWYIYHKVVLPPERFNAAIWVYQISILIALIDITQVPYNSSITAHEKLGFMSFWNNINTLLRLGAAIILSMITLDKLIIYAVLTFVITLFIAIGFRIYCLKKFDECHIIKVNDKTLFKKILSFASYNAFNSFAVILRSQGTNLLINRFFGVALNASTGIANMVSGNIINFTFNIIISFKPQIIKSYATNHIEKMQAIMTNCAKYAVSIYSLIAIPIFLEMDYVLKLWLGNVPQYSSLFCKIMLISGIFNLINLITVIGLQATNKIRTNSILICIISFCGIVTTYFLFMTNLLAYMAFISLLLVEISILCISLSNLKRQIPSFKILSFIIPISWIFLLTITASLPGVFIKIYINSSFLRFIEISLSYLLSFGTLFFYFVIDHNMRKSIFHKLYSYIR